MKLSLAWIFDHLKTSWKEHDIRALMHRFNTTTAEIDSYVHLVIDLKALTLGQVKKNGSEQTVVYSFEHNKEYTVPLRADAREDQFFLLKQDQGHWRWAQECDIGGTKETLLPAFSVAQHEQAGAWKKDFETEDYILTIDNIALSHRPDLWGHRGIAREVGALLGVELVAPDEIFETIPVTTAQKEITRESFRIALDVSSDFCKRFAAVHLQDIQNRPSFLNIAHRLVRVESRPITSIVDITNYVMFDIGQPLHAFDAKKIVTHQLVVKQSLEGQKITLLDGHDLTLAEGDIVITDGKKPVALAGIMGGQATAVQSDTTEIFLESAAFTAAKIRKATHHYKIRTEASTRFEKSLDPHNNICGLMRFLKILKQYDGSSSLPSEIFSLGMDVQPHTIVVAHTFIERMLGVSLEEQFVVKTLRALSFGVTTVQTNGMLEYQVEVPTFRGTKDVLYPQDIVEEVGRYFGFDAIPHILPALRMKPSDLTRFDRMNRIKNYCAYAAHAHEVRNYALFDEDFLKLLGWAPLKSGTIKNPISTTMYRLVTSLVPHLLKNVYTNATHKDAYNFFELNKIWHTKEAPTVQVQEHTALAGIFFDAVQAIDFFEKKEIITELFHSLGMEIEWRKAQSPEPWFHPYQTAELFLNNQLLGFAGMANPAFLQAVIPGSAFIFELNADIIFDTQLPSVIYKPLPKYQDSWRDVSMLVPLAVTVQQLEEQIMKASAEIVLVSLIDFFQKEEWHDVRSVTIRFYVRHEEKTLLSEEVDVVAAKVANVVKALGATIR